MEHPPRFRAWSSFSRDRDVALTRLPLCSLMNRQLPTYATKFTQIGMNSFLGATKLIGGLLRHLGVVRVEFSSSTSFRIHFVARTPLVSDSLRRADPQGFLARAFQVKSSVWCCVL